MLLPMSDQGEWHTVKQLSRLAGVSTRTLHDYDEIGLLRPTRIAANGHRQYDHPALLRLQQSGSTASSASASIRSDRS